MPHAQVKWDSLETFHRKGIYFSPPGIRRLVGSMLIGVLIKGEQFHMRIST